MCLRQSIHLLSLLLFVSQEGYGWQFWGDRRRHYGPLALRLDKAQQPCRRPCETDVAMPLQEGHTGGRRDASAHTSRFERHFRHPTRLLATKRAKDAATTDEASGAIDTLTNPPDGEWTVTTPLMRVYIEDTDAYGVMYNSNYLRAYERALHMFGDLHRVDQGGLDQKQQQPPQQQQGTPRSILSLEQWSMVSIDQLKFKSSPPLGGTYVISGQRRPSNLSTVALDDNDTVEVWDLTMIRSDGDHPCSFMNTTDSVVYSTATGVRIAQPPAASRDTSPTVSSRPGLSWLPRPAPFSTMSIPISESVVTPAVHRYRTFRDEFDLDGPPGRLPLHSVLNLFERSRTNLLGGPEALRRLQQEDGILYVVTSLEDCSLVGDEPSSYEATNGRNDPEETSSWVVPGSQVTVTTSFAARKRGMVLECFQTAWVEDRYRIAQARILLMAIQAETRRPTSQIPNWVQERLSL